MHSKIQARPRSFSASGSRPRWCSDRSPWLRSRDMRSSAWFACWRSPIT